MYKSVMCKNIEMISVLSVFQRNQKFHTCSEEVTSYEVKPTFRWRLCRWHRTDGNLQLMLVHRITVNIPAASWTERQPPFVLLFPQ